MRISGNYFDRLVTNVLPYSILGIVLLWFCSKISMSEIIIIFTGFTGFLWLMDTLILYFKKVKTLRIGDGIYFGNVRVTPQDILGIKPVTDDRYRRSFKTIEFIVLVNGIDEKITVIDKPMTVIEDIFGRRSKTLRLLFKTYPELKSKFAFKHDG